MAKVDVLTMLYVLALGNIILLLLYVAYFRQTENPYGDKLWLAAKGFQAIGWMLLAGRGVIVNIWSVSGGNSCLIAGITLECLALLMAGKRLRLIDGVFYGALAMVGTILAMLNYDGSGVVLVVGGSLITFSQYAYLGSRMLRFKRRRSSLHRFLGCFVLGISLVMLLRGAVFVFLGTGHSLFSPQPVQTLAFLAMYLLMLIGGLTYLFILRENMDRRLLRESRTDYLTELPNRRAFFERAQQSIAVCREKNLAVGVILIDIDNFKDINDSYGHEAGDEVLRYMGGFFFRHLPVEAIIGRTGGEEFAVCLPDCSEGEAWQLCQELKQERHKTVWKEYPIEFSISIGLSHADPEESEGRISLSELLRHADRCLYQAKADGRNTIVGEKYCLGQSTVS